MSFVISLTLLINGNNAVINLFPGLEWYIPGLEIDLYSRVWLFRMVGPMQQGMLYSVGLILLN